MPIYTVEIDGKQYDLEGDHPPSEAEARAAVASYAPKPTPPPQSSTLGMMAPSTAQGEPKAPSRLLDLVPQSERDQGMDRYKDSLAMMVPATEMIAAAKQAPGVIARMAGISKTRAGQNIAEAVTAAKDVPLATEGIQSALGEMTKYTGIENVPRVARALAKRLATNEPLTVEKARLYYPAISRGAANEFANLTPNMQRLLGGLKAPMNDAITAAAETVGKGEQYAAGMKEYARAGRAAAAYEEKVKPAVRTALKRLLQGGALGAGYETVRHLMD